MFVLKQTWQMGLSSQFSAQTFSVKNILFSFLIFQFNANKNVEGKNTSLRGAWAHYIRIHPVDYVGASPCLRIALYGCDSGNQLVYGVGYTYSQIKIWRGSFVCKILSFLLSCDRSFFWMCIGKTKCIFSFKAYSTSRNDNSFNSLKSHVCT